MKRVWLVLLLIIPISAPAAEVEGVRLPDSVSLQGETLHLNGAGVRTKFFFDIYVGALYRQRASRHAAAVLASPASTVVSMDILYKMVDGEKLRHGWQEGFRKNQTAAAMRTLRKRLDRFNELFRDARRGDRYRFDFRRDGSTLIRFNGEQVGVIAGEDFQRALLAVWLGDKPADEDLKHAMLGGK